jgi:2-polyprenyl-6-methoxyphenol hydroxylase-like FAD-dependent oxidoreductase
MSCGFNDVETLLDAINEVGWGDLASALQKYSELRVPEAHAITDLNFLLFVRDTPAFMASELIASKLFKKPTCIQCINDPNMQYSAMLKR